MASQEPLLRTAQDLHPALQFSRRQKLGPGRIPKKNASLVMEFRQPCRPAIVYSESLMSAASLVSKRDP